MSAGEASAGGGAEAVRDAGRKADAAASVLEARFGSRLSRVGLRNTAPWRLRQTFDFNYWWLAHAVETRLDAFARTGSPRHLESAVQLYERIRRRNGGTFVNDYFDDMGWLAIAAIRLADATGEEAPLRDAIGLWTEIDRAGWNEIEGASVSWRRGGPGYKNAPSNGTFAIASLRLWSRTGDERFRQRGVQALRWIERRLVTPAGLVLDGVNRNGDGLVDSEWVFSYNQGLYVGALTELGASAGAPAGASAGAPAGAPAGASALAAAARTAEAAIAALAPAGVITTENSRFERRGGGDVGLFKGIFVRYLEGLASRLGSQDPTEAASPVIPAFIRGCTDRLWDSMAGPDARPGLAGDDWGRAAPRRAFLSTQLGAVMALEARARLEERASRRGSPDAASAPER